MCVIYMLYVLGANNLSLDLNNSYESYITGYILIECSKEHIGGTIIFE